MASYNIYDEAAIIKKALKGQFELTPVPEKLTIEWEHDSLYSFQEIHAKSSLVWIDVLQRTFDDAIPDYDWVSDQVDTICASDEYEEFMEAPETPFNVKILQRVADKALANYAKVFAKLAEAGLTAEND